jgi:hypothetical protein
VIRFKGIKRSLRLSFNNLESVILSAAKDLR